VSDSEGDDDAPASTTIAPMVQHPVPRPARVGAEDSALSSIVGGITIPASELGIDDARPKAAASAPVRVAAAESRPKAEAAKPATKPETTKPGPKGAKPATAAPAVTDAKGKKKPATPAPKTKAKPPAEPPRTWAKLVKANPAVFRGKSAWWTPLRATNRLLTGPFKDDDAAQDFVNALKKAGVSAYAFTSDAGQKVTKLPAK
jgi:cell division protein FtsN